MGDSTYHIPESMVEETRNFRREVAKLVAGEIEMAAFRPLGGAMGVYEQREKNTFMVRARGAAGVFLPHQARCIAKLACRFANGLVHVTTRQDLQLHRLDLRNVPDVVEALLDAGVPSRGSGGNTVRNVTACHLSGVCPKEAFDVTPYALALTEYLIADPANFRLPRKLKVALSGCPEDCALASVADVGLFAHERDGALGFSVYAAGGLGLHPAVALPLEEFVPAAEVFEAVEAVKRLFDRHGDRANRHRARLRFVVERVGAEEFRRLYQEERARVRREGLRFPTVPETAPAPVEAVAPGADAPDDAVSRAWRERHVFAQKQAGYFAVRVRLPRGLVSSEQLCSLADLAVLLGDGTLRAVQDQNLQIRQVSGEVLPDLFRALRQMNEAFVAAPPVRCIACTGAATCRLGKRLSGGLATAVETALADLPMGVEPPLRVSGCPNSCGQHPIAPIGLSGGAIRVDGAVLPVYSLFAGGRLGEGTAALGELIGKVPARAVPALLRAFWFAAGEERREGESTASLMARWGAARLRELVPSYQEPPAYADAPEFYRDFGSDQELALSASLDGA